MGGSYHVELSEFERNKVWRLIERRYDASIIGVEWVYKNKLDNYGHDVRNKACLVVKGYCQQEGILIMKKTFIHFFLLKQVWIFLAYATQEFRCFQMDVNCVFLNSASEETAYVEQPLCFINDKHQDHCYVLDKLVYGLKSKLIVHDTKPW